MKFGALAVDYDGTIAQEGVLDHDVKDAIIEARARGIVVALVTGRILSELWETLGGLRPFDAVVAENGAVLAFQNGQSRFIGDPPRQIFLDELQQQIWPTASGSQSIVRIRTNLLADFSGKRINGIDKVDYPSRSIACRGMSLNCASSET